MIDLEHIARQLAECDPATLYGDEGNFGCGYCGSLDTEGRTSRIQVRDPDLHEGYCIWAQARRWSEKHPARM